MNRPGAASDTALVRLPNWLGDALMARPFLAELRRRAARVVALGPPALLGLLEPDGAWDESHAWPPGPDALRRVRAHGPRVAYVLPPSFSSAWFALRTGARERVGYAGEWRSALLTRAPRRPARGDRHVGREYLALLGEAAAAREAPPVPPPLRVPADAEREAEGARREAGARGNRYAILAPGAIYGPAKRWPLERFAELARALRAAGHEVLACGAPADAARCAALAAASAGACASLAGRLSLPGQAALCARAAAVVSNDSGMAHLAAATGAPTVAIFGSTSSAWTAPLGSRVRVVQRPPVCSPCFRRTCAIGYACLGAVGVRDVLARLGELGVAGLAGAAA